jgi:hypothetical protein
MQRRVHGQHAKAEGHQASCAGAPNQGQPTQQQQQQRQQHPMPRIPWAAPGCSQAANCVELQPCNPPVPSQLALGSTQGMGTQTSLAEGSTVWQQCHFRSSGASTHTVVEGPQHTQQGLNESLTQHSASMLPFFLCCVQYTPADKNRKPHQYEPLPPPPPEFTVVSK